MGAGQSTVQNITNKITNKINLTAENIAAASQSVSAQTITTMEGVTISGDLTIEQYAEVKAIMDAFIQTTQNFTVSEDMINDIAAAAAQEVPNLTASINVQKLKQDIKNTLTNEMDLQQIVRSSCDFAASVLTEARLVNVIANKDVKIKQRAIADVASKCLISNQQYATAMQKLSNKVQVEAKQTVKDIITGVVALIVMGMIGVAVSKGATKAVADRRFVEAADRRPSLWIIWSVPILLAVGTLAALDCGGKFPLVPKFLTFGIPIPPSMCRQGDKMVDKTECKGAFGRDCEVVRDDEGRPVKVKVASYSPWGYYLYMTIFGLIGIFVVLQVRK